MGQTAGIDPVFAGYFSCKHNKRLSTCAGTFANAVNFQGFPHMPGNDFVMRAIPGSSTTLDGGSLFR